MNEPAAPTETFTDATERSRFELTANTQQRGEPTMDDVVVAKNLKGISDLDFEGGNKADRATFSHFHTDVVVHFNGQPVTRGVDGHVESMKTCIEAVGGTPPRIVAHPIAFGAGEWTGVVSEYPDGGRMVTAARWVDGAIAEESIWG